VPSTSLVVDRCAIAAAIVLTCVLFTSRAADPVNVIKLTALLLCALVLMGSATYRVVRHRVVRLPVGLAGVAGAVLLLAFVASAWAGPVTATAVLGAYGRNSGLLAYAGGLVLFFAGLRALAGANSRWLVGAVAAAGLFTATYGLLQRLGIDAIPWNNPFNPIIAAMGNPNFASGYLGVAASVAAGGALWKGWAIGWRLACAGTALLCLITAALSSSVQGPIAAAAGFFVLAAAATLNLPSRSRRFGLGALFSLAAVTMTVFLLGAVNGVGPAAGIFADYGSRARTYYWQAALDMFSERPLLGVGLDHFGSFWRSSRSPESVAFLGGGGYSDAAHSVPLQMLAQGGLLLGLAYALFVGVVLAALVRGLLRLHGADRMLLAALGAGWAAYQVQSFVSIDQVPLLVLHFALASAVLAVSGWGGLREVRLPGALVAAPLLASDKRTKRRLAAAGPKERQPTASDAILLSIAALLLLVAAWQSVVPLRANMAVSTGDKLLAQGDGNGALDAYRTATDLAPDSPVYWGRQGALYLQVQQPALARQAWEQAAEADPYDIAALRTAASLAEQAGDLDEARETYARALGVDPLNEETVVAATRFELRHDGARRARAVLERAAAQASQQPGIWAALGDAQAVLGDEAAAREAYQQALALEEGHQEATAGLAKLDAGR
jgi:O-antigen ligase